MSRLSVYYISLLVLSGLLAAVLLQPNDAMGMPAMVSVSVVLGLYVVAVGLVGEGKLADERASLHRFFANRAAWIAGVAILSAGVLYQLFSHRLDSWLLAALVGMNVAKVASLIYSHHRR